MFVSNFQNQHDNGEEWPEWHSKPFKLTIKELQDPIGVFRSFFNEYDLPDIRFYLEIIHNRQDEYFYKKGGLSFIDDIGKIVEAASIIDLQECSDRHTVQDSTEKFMAILAHELKGNFATVISCVDSIEQQPPNFDLAENRNFYLSTIKAVATIALNTIENMITTVVFNRGKLNFNLVAKRILFKDFIRQFKDAIINIGNSQNDCLCIEIDDAVPATITTDDVKFYAVIRNILINAFQNRKPDSTVTVRCEWDSGLSVKIINEGDPIPLDERRKIFTPFHKHSLSTGSGIGLYLSDLYMSIIGGRISVNSYSGLNEFQLFISEQKLTNMDSNSGD